jgi:hypothetical protein
MINGYKNTMNTLVLIGVIFIVLLSIVVVGLVLLRVYVQERISSMFSVKEAPFERKMYAAKDVTTGEAITSTNKNESPLFKNTLISFARSVRARTGQTP